MQLDFFTDRLEIHSPGGLYGRTTVEELGHSRPDLRNPALAVMADTLTDAENRYSGIPTIRREMAAYSLPEPLFENRRGEFVVTLRHSMEPAEPSCDGGHRRTCFPIAQFRAPGRKLLPFWELRRPPMLSASMYCRWWKQAN